MFEGSALRDRHTLISHTKWIIGIAEDACSQNAKYVCSVYPYCILLTVYSVGQIVGLFFFLFLFH